MRGAAVVAMVWVVGCGGSSAVTTAKTDAQPAAAPVVDDAPPIDFTADGDNFNRIHQSGSSNEAEFDAKYKGRRVKMFLPYAKIEKESETGRYALIVDGIFRNQHYTSIVGVLRPNQAADAANFKTFDEVCVVGNVESFTKNNGPQYGSLRLVDCVFSEGTATYDKKTGKFVTRKPK